MKCILFLSKFSFERLPSPLQANSQKLALKLVATSRKVKHLLTVLSYEEFTKLTGLTAEKLEKIFTKSEHIEQKLIEGMYLYPRIFYSSRVLVR